MSTSEAAVTMTSSSTTPDSAMHTEEVAERSLIATFRPHLLAMYFPLLSTLFLATGPHSWWVALLYLIPLDLAYRLDRRAPALRRQPADDLVSWPFDLLIYVLVGLQLLNILLLAIMYSQVAWLSVDLVMAAIVEGASSGFSIITAHELIHRRNPFQRLLGRLLLCSVLYEHFYTEHLRGHHVRVGTPQDPATARFGESFHQFYARTVPAQYRSAWQLEKKRLGDPSMPFLDRRWFRNRVLHGIGVGWGIGALIFISAGPVALTAFVLQALTASRLLEVVNYFEHWGLVRTTRNVRPQDSWDTHSAFTYYGLVGLSRHADHHAHSSRPYEQLRVWEEAPLLPGGYVETIAMVMLTNRRYREYASSELQRRELGPFAPE